MSIKIALAGNPNCGKTTLYNALTGSNQYVGNWPGVTVEKKEGEYKKENDVIITDLPGIYSLSPYTSEEVVARNYLVGEHPDAILNIIDGTNLERNLYLSTQLMELGIPVVLAVNMMDVVEKRGDRIDIGILSKKLGCKTVTISALMGIGLDDAAEAAICEAKAGKGKPNHIFSGEVEHALAHIEEAFLHEYPEEKQRWLAIKIFERDEKVLEELNIPKNTLDHIENDIRTVEKYFDDDSEAIIINERYNYIESLLKDCYIKKNAVNTSSKIDRIVTGKYLGLPIFCAIMFLVYYISMVGFGSYLTDWANNGVFGDGWHLFGMGSTEYAEAREKYADSDEIIEAFSDKYLKNDISEVLDADSVKFSEEEAKRSLANLVTLTPNDASIPYNIIDEESLEITEHKPVGKLELQVAVREYLSKDYKQSFGAPDSSEYGIWVKGIPVITEDFLNKIGASEWQKGLLLYGVISGAGSVLGFLPQMAILFFLLSFLEACGYMSRIAFVLDRLFRKFGLSGKSFIPILIGTGCGVTGIMASRTIENERDRRMTVMTTTFIPCGAKVPFISMIAGALFGGSAIVATSAYFIGMAAIIISGIILKKMKFFRDGDTPFVMELPEYHLPTFSSVMSTTWDRVWSFAKKAGTVILLSTVCVWFLTYFGFDSAGKFKMLSESELNYSFLAKIGGALSFLFIPLGFGKWQTAVASLAGILAKENIVGTLGVFYGASGNVYNALASEVFTPISAYSFMAFNILCAPCIAAISAIRREMNSAKWLWITLAYQTAFAYSVALMINQFGNLFIGNADIFGSIAASGVLIIFAYLIFRKDIKEN